MSLDDITPKQWDSLRQCRTYEIERYRPSITRKKQDKVAEYYRNRMENALVEAEAYKLAYERLRREGRD